MAPPIASEDSALGVEAAPHISLPVMRRTWRDLLTRLQALVASKMDAALIAFLLWNLSVLILTTMPTSYFFGLKATLLKSISQSLLYKAYVRLLAPASVAGFGVAIITSRVSRTGARSRWMGLTFANALLTYVQGRFYELVRGDARPVLELEERAADRELVNWRPPPLPVMSLLTFPQRCLLSSQLLGVELLPASKERLLFVGNHAVWGLDVGLLLHSLYSQTGIFPRALGSHAWFAAPLMKELMDHLMGGVDGTEHNCTELMKRGKNLLVYPGGEREAWKKSSDTKYSLIWGEARGFARLALRHNYTIIPVATVGTEDAFRVVADFPLSKALRLGGLIPAAESKKVAGNAFVEGTTLPLILPQISEMQRVYFKLGKPIPARLPHFHGSAFIPDIGDPESNVFEPTDEEVSELRDEVRDAIAEEVSWLLSYRSEDPERYARPARAAQALQRGLARGGERSKL